MDRKEQIIQLAHELIDTKGYGGFSYADIQNNLGIKKASIHHHFAKKEDLGLAVLDLVEDYLVQKRGEIDSLQGSAWEKVLTLIGPGCDQASCSNRVCTLSALQHNFDQLPESMQQRLRSLCIIERKILSDVIETGKQAGDLDFTVSADKKAASILSTIKGAMHYARIFGPESIEAAKADIKSCLKA